MRLIYTLLFGLLGLLLAAYGLISCSQTISTVSVQPTARPRFQGTILVASDADQIATAYADGVLNKVAGIEDSLTVLIIDSSGTTHKGQVPVSNSVISWPWILTHSPDGRYAYVAETRDAYTGSATRVKDVWRDMPPGAAMTVVDISQPTRPTIVQKRPLGRNLSNASVNQTGDLLATGSTESGRELVISTLRAGLIDSVYTFPIAGIDPKRGTNAGVKGVEFHPTRNVVAVNLNNQDVFFYEIQPDGRSLTVRPIGTPLRVATCWSVGNWHPNGQFFILTDVAWGQGSLGAVMNGRGKLVSVAFTQTGQHRIVSEATVGLSPEGFDLSPDGKWAVAVNMRRTYLPDAFPTNLFPARHQASLSLVAVDPQTGQLTVRGDEYGFEGALPEDAVFDKDSRTLAVVVYNAQDELFPRKGYVEFWTLDDGKLVRSPLKIALTRGPHTLKLVR